MKKTIKNKYIKLQADLKKKINTGKFEGLSLSDILCINGAGKELLKKHTAKTMIKNVADYFKRFGFLVTMDFDNVNYVIVEA